MAYYSEKELKQFGFKKIGKNVKISCKASIYNPELIEIGDNSRIDDFCIISGKIKLGRNVHIAPHCLLAGGECGIEMGDFSGLAYYVQVFTQSDDYSGNTMTNPTVSAKYKNEMKKSILIGRHCIIGASSVIMPGVIIREGCSVGALSLVRKSTLEWGVYLGNPAKRLKDRSKNILTFEQQLIEDEKNDSI